MPQDKRLSRRKFLSLSLTSAGVFGINTLIRPAYAQASESNGGGRLFADDIGRSVRIPTTINSVTPTGINAQTMLFELCPEKIASLAMEVASSDASDYMEAELDDALGLPETGTLLSTSDIDIASEEIVDISPTIMLDVGLPQDGLVDKLNTLQLETNIPYIFIDISFGKLAGAYRTLGLLLGCTQRAEALAGYVESVMSEVEGIANRQEGACKVFYAQRSLGLSVTGGISLQLEAIAYAGGTPVDGPYDYINKSVDIDTVGTSDTDWILFDDTDMLDSLLSGQGKAWDTWSGVLASCGACFAVSPALYHSWLGSMVFVQSIGLLWLANVMWPASCAFDMDRRAQQFYDLFYGRELEEDTAQELIGEAPIQEIDATITPEIIDAYSEEVHVDE